MHLVKVLMKLRYAQADLNLRWAHMSEGTALDVKTHLYIGIECFCFLLKRTDYNDNNFSVSWKSINERKR